MGTKSVSENQVYASSQNWPVTEGRQYEKFSKNLECADENGLRVHNNGKTNMKPYSAARIDSCSISPLLANERSIQSPIRSGRDDQHQSLFERNLMQMIDDD